MRSKAPLSSVRRVRRDVERRSRRRPALIAGGLAFAVVVAAGITTTGPTSQAEASGSFANFALASYTATVADTVTPAAPTDAIATEVRDALAAADASLAASATITAAIAASGLDLGADTTVDTAALAAAVERLESAAGLPAPLVPRFTKAVAAQVAAVDERVAGLRGSLDAAKALKAKQEAAEKAREAAAAAAAQKANTSTPSGPSFASGGSGGSGGDNSPAGAQASARAMLGNYGWGDDQFSCLVSLWNKESGWNYQAYNPSSGAFGIPQALPGSKMATAGADWQSNAATQVAWGLGYISGRYGSPCGAWGHSQSVGWY